MEKIFGRDHVIARLQKLQLSPQRICANQVAVQSWIPNFVVGWEYAVVSHDRRTSADRVAKIPTQGQGGKDDVLQSRTDKSQGHLLQASQNCIARQVARHFEWRSASVSASCLLPGPEREVRRRK